MKKQLEARISTDVRSDHFSTLTNKLHHGQKTLIMRSFVYAIHDMLLDDRMPEIYSWLVGDSELILPKIPTNLRLDLEP